MIEQAVLPEPSTATADDQGPEVVVAGMWRRLLAALVDGLLLVPALSLLGWVALKISGQTSLTREGAGLESLVELALEENLLLSSVSVTALIILLLYGFLFMVTTGATPGLRLLRLQVIDLYGQTPSWWRALRRCLGFVLSVAFLGLGLLWIGFDREKRGLHDWLAGTYVVRVSARGNTGG